MAILRSYFSHSPVSLRKAFEPIAQLGLEREVGSNIEPYAQLLIERPHGVPATEYHQVPSMFVVTIPLPKGRVKSAQARVCRRSRQWSRRRRKSARRGGVTARGRKVRRAALLELGAALEENDVDEAPNRRLSTSRDSARKATTTKPPVFLES